MARFSVFYNEQTLTEAFFEADSEEEARQIIVDIEDGNLDFDKIILEEKWRDGSYDFDKDTIMLVGESK